MKEIVFVLIVVAVILFNVIKILREWERGVILRLGKFQAVRGPGIIFIIPLIEKMIRISTRIITVDVPPQDIITRDNVTMSVNAVVFFRVLSPREAIVNVEEFGSVYSHRVVRRLIPYLRPFRGRVILALAGMIVYIAAREFQPLLIGNLIDAGTHGDLGAVNRNGVIFVLLALVSWAAYTTQLINTGWIGHRVLFTLRTKMFNHLQKLSLRFIR